MTTIVIDAGSYQFRSGIASDNKPRLICPSQVGEIPDGSKMTGQVALARYHEEMRITETISRGKVTNWECFEAMMKYSNDTIFENTQPSLRYLVADGFDSDHENRSKLATLLFEKFDASAIFFSKTAPLSLYSCARNTGLVLEIGHESSTCSAVSDGQIYSGSQTRSDVAGLQISRALLEQVEKTCKLHPRFELSVCQSKDGTADIKVCPASSTSCYRNFFQMQIINEMKHEICSVNLGSVDTQAPEADESSYCLPDGTVVSSVETIGHQVTNLLFDPSPLGRPDVNMSLPDLVMRSSKAVGNAELRRDMFANVVVCGGTSSIPGCADRLAGTLATAVGKTIKSRVITQGVADREFAPWIGGSIIGSMSSLNDIWVTKQEFLEFGAGIVNKKCP